jgi:hypothetical protein
MQDPYLITCTGLELHGILIALLIIDPLLGPLQVRTDG